MEVTYHEKRWSTTMMKKTKKVEADPAVHVHQKNVLPVGEWMHHQVAPHLHLVSSDTF